MCVANLIETVYKQLAPETKYVAYSLGFCARQNGWTPELL